jgi:mRNA (guanine-N7-)-methyltransferase
MRLTYKEPFHNVLQEEQGSRDFGPLLSKMGVVDAMGSSAMDANQWEAASESRFGSRSYEVAG